MAPAAVKTLASSFEGLNGATALSTIAFSVVFIVLIFLTLVIYAMRLVSRFAGAEKPAAAPA
ncbi:MAG: OadG family protein, partial [Pyramidobacter sp.]|nr:OadG family protein [Pyramidobacter sp.]